MTGRVLVTGGAGFIGSHVVDRLIAEDRAVTVLDNFATGHRDNLRDAQKCGDVIIVDASILDRPAIEAAIAGCDTVYHLAVECVRRSLGKPIENHEVNATGTLNVLEASRRAGVSRFVYCSSSEVYGNASAGLLNERTTLCEPTTVYGAAKLAGEYYTKAYYRTYGLPAVIVRPFNSYGPREHDRGDLAEVIPRFVIRMLNGSPPMIFGTGENSRDFTYVTETAQGILLAGRSDALLGREVNIAYGQNVSVLQVAEAIARLLQRPDLVPVHLDVRPGDVVHLHADVGLAREALGFRAKIDLTTGLTEYLQWFNRTYPDPTILAEADPINWSMPQQQP
jgi:UDP-glucose 4-epimerase